MNYVVFLPQNIIMNVAKYSPAGVIRDCKILSIIAESDNLYALAANLIIYHYRRFNLAAKITLREFPSNHTEEKMFMVKHNNMLIICDHYGNSKFIYNIRTETLLFDYTLRCQFIQNPAGAPITFRYTNGVFQTFNLANASRQNFRIDIMSMSRFSRLVFAGGHLFAVNSAAIFEIGWNEYCLSDAYDLERSFYANYCGGQVMTLGGNRLEIYFGDDPLPLVKKFTILREQLQKCVLAIFLAIRLPRDIILEIISRIK